MQSISSTAGLKNAIEILEAEQAVKGQLLKEQFYITYESLKPITVLRRTFKELTSSQYLIDNIPGAIMGLVSGFLSRKLIVGRSANIFRKLLGSVLQVGVTNVVARKSDSIQSKGLSIFQHYLQKKILNSKTRVI
jgi:hypothetical protein